MRTATARAEPGPVHVQERDECVLNAVGVAVAVDAGGLRMVTAINRLPRADGARRGQDDVRRVRVVFEVRRCAHRLRRDRVVDEVLCEAERHDVGRHSRWIGPDAFQLVRRVRDEVRAQNARAARFARQHVAAVLRLHAGPRAPSHVAEEGVDVVLQCLARVQPAVAIRRREAVRPLRPPVDEVDGRFLLDADRAVTEIAAVVDEVVRNRIDRALGRLPRSPEEMLRVRDRRGCGRRGAHAPDDREHRREEHQACERAS